MSSNPFEQDIGDIRQAQKAVEKAAEESPDVKEGKCTAEDEKKEPGYILYQAISETSIKIMQLPDVIRIFDTIAKTFGPELAKSLVELFAITMTHSAHQAVLFYDDLLKVELQKQFDNMSVAINNAGSMASAHEGVLRVFKKRLGEVENGLKLKNEQPDEE